jgi:hypothetical protein
MEKSTNLQREDPITLPGLNPSSLAMYPPEICRIHTNHWKGSMNSDRFTQGGGQKVEKIFVHSAKDFKMNKKERLGEQSKTVEMGKKRKKS